MASLPGSPSSSAITSMDQTTRPGRVLGLDLGDARIGVAVSDDDRRMAVGVGTVPTGAPEDIRAIMSLIDEYSATLVVVGLPLSMNGTRGSEAHKAEAFAGVLADLLRVPVELQDERLSTVEAERGLRDAGVAGADRRRAVDRSAAAVILQAWLDAHP